LIWLNSNNTDNFISEELDEIMIEFNKKYLVKTYSMDYILNTAMTTTMGRKE